MTTTVRGERGRTLAAVGAAQETEQARLHDRLEKLVDEALSAFRGNPENALDRYTAATVVLDLAVRITFEASVAHMGSIDDAETVTSEAFMGALARAVEEEKRAWTALTEAALKVLHASRALIATTSGSTEAEVDEVFTEIERQLRR